MYTFSLSVGDLVRWYYPSSRKSAQSSDQLLNAAEIGQSIHQKWQHQQHKASTEYDSERAVRFEYVSQNIRLVLNGRVDGVQYDQQRIEEIKTVASLNDTIPPHFRAQVTVYGWLLAMEQGWDSVCTRLVRIERSSERSQVDDCETTLAALFDDSMAMVEAYMCALVAWFRHIEQRQISLSNAALPFADFRVGQREIAETVFKAQSLNRQLVLSAQTGHGKTYGVLVPTLKYLAQSPDGALYLTHRNSVKSVVQKAIIDWPEANAALWWLRLDAEDNCPDRDSVTGVCGCALPDDETLRALRQSFLEQPCWSIRDVDTAMQAHDCCAHTMARLLAPYADLNIADINTILDYNAENKDLLTIWGPTAHPAGRHWLLDEIHQCQDRSESYFSNQFMRWVHVPGKTRRTNLFKHFEGVLVGDPLPGKFFKQLETLAKQLETASAGADTLDPELLGLYFEIMALQQLEARYPDMLRLKSIDDDAFEVAPIEIASILHDRWQTANSVVGFSATAEPFDTLMRQLGLENATGYRAPDIYRSDQVTVRWIDQFDLRYQYRQQEIPRLCEFLAQSLIDGVNFIYAPSFAFLEQLMAHLGEDGWCYQPRDLTTDSAGQWLSSVCTNGRQNVVLVLGSRLVEGITASVSLDRVAIITLGLAPPDVWIDQKIQWLERQGVNGYEALVTIPAMKQCAQAAGRLIRKPEDQGEIWLIDHRWPRYRHWLPRWWFNRPAA
ncbi:MAG: hypothetical protein HWE20_13505 [Gammaproteobacteria bacterium]|nr:hypothetical protein [Gammaproteobacteria bacterium]